MHRQQVCSYVSMLKLFSFPETRNKACIVELLCNEHPSRSDEALLDELMTGSTDAAAALFDKYSGFVYALAWRITGDERAAEEVLHSVFMELWRSPRKPNTRQHGFAIWLFIICRQRAKTICADRPKIHPAA